MQLFWVFFSTFCGQKIEKKIKYFSNRIEKLHKMAFIYIYIFFFEKVEKSWKNWNYLHKIFVTMYSIPYTRAGAYFHKSFTRHTVIGERRLIAFFQLMYGIPNNFLIWYSYVLVGSSIWTLLFQICVVPNIFSDM